MTTTTVGRRIPPQRLINLVNPLVRAALTSPLHAALDNTLLILHIRGRKTGHRYDIPVGCSALDGNLVVVTQHRWRANLRDCPDIEATYRGRRQKMGAHLDEEPVIVAGLLQQIITRVGPKAAERQLGLKFPCDRAPDLPELTEAVRQYQLSSLTLTPEASKSTSSPGSTRDALRSPLAADRDSEFPCGTGKSLALRLSTEGGPSHTSVNRVGC